MNSIYVAIPKYSKTHILFFQVVNKINRLLLTDILGNSIKKEFLFDAALAGTELVVSVCKGIDGNDVYIVEDIVHYCRQFVQHINLSKKLLFIKNVLEHPILTATTFVLYLPCIWEDKQSINLINVPYEMGGIQQVRLGNETQRRSHNFCSPVEKENTVSFSKQRESVCREKDRERDRETLRSEKKKEKEKEKEKEMEKEKENYAIFEIRPVALADIYHLYSMQNGVLQYHSVACIPNYKTSIMMNSLFRCIKENQNLDLIEESDSESECEYSEDRFKIKDVKIDMVCRRHEIFGKWVPIKEV
jgi:hypothetical protein